MSRRTIDRHTVMGAILALIVTCGGTVVSAVGCSRVVPGRPGIADIGGALSASTAPWEGATSFRGSTVDDLDTPAPPPPSAADTRSATPASPIESNAPGETSGIEGPSDPTPFGIMLFGLFGVGTWLHRRRRRMSVPLFRTH